jgi:hypothetical protein
MDMKSLAVVACFAAAVWAGARLMRRRNRHREFVLYTAALGWAAYSVIASLRQWPQMTAVSVVQYALGPVGTLLIRMIGQPIG